MSFSIPLNIKIELGKDFEQKYKNAVEKSVNHIKKNIQQSYPSTIGGSIKSDIDYDNGVARIGWDKGSKKEMIASVLETGSGERGKYGGSYVLPAKPQNAGPYSPPRELNTKMPNYTIPIVPTNSKKMAFKGRKGNTVFMKEFKGHIPKYYFSNAVVKSMKFLPIIIENEMKK